MPAMAGGITAVYLLCLLLSVAKANFIDDLLNKVKQPHQGGPKSDSDAGANWKWTSKPEPRAPTSGPQVFDVTKFGAKNDGSSDSTKAFLDAWKGACSYAGESWLVVPEGEFLLGETIFKGPCHNNSSPTVEIRGTVKAVKDLGKFSDKHWIMFRELNGLNIFGGGTLDGQGDQGAWLKNEECDKCKMMPVTLKIIAVSNANIRQIYLVNSKAFHMHVTDSKKVHIYDVKITAPEDSPNTDGVHISSSTGIKVTDSYVGVGDDCISIGDGTKNIMVVRVICGPGHGISIGSLGKYENEEPVEDIRVQNCTLDHTSNGLRIKTWAGSAALTATNFTFENIIMNLVSFPIIIDQHYCPSKSCGNQPPSKVKISNIMYKNIRGTSFTKLAINLMCSKDIPCEKVHLSDIDLQYQDPSSKTVSLCSHAHVTTSGNQNPPPCK